MNIIFNYRKIKINYSCSIIILFNSNLQNEIKNIGIK